MKSIAPPDIHKTSLKKDISSYKLPTVLVSSDQYFSFTNKAFQALFSSSPIYSVSELLKKIQREKVKDQIKNFFKEIKNKPYLSSTFSLPTSSVPWQILILPYYENKSKFYLFYFIPHIEFNHNENSIPNQMSQKELEYYERYNALFHRSMEGIFLQLVNGQFIDFNEKAREILEIPKSCTPTQFTLSDFLKEEEYDRALYLIPEIIEKQYHKKPVIYKIKTYKGNTRYLQAWTSIVYKEGLPYAFVSTGKDITEIMHYEHELGQLRITLDTLLNNIEQGFLLLNQQGEVLIANKQAIKFCDACNLPVPIIGKLWVQKVQNNFYEYIQKALRFESSTITIQSKSHQEKPLWIQIHFWPVFNNQHHFLGVGINFTNITTAYELQKALFQKEFFYETLIKNINEVIILLSKDLTISYTSPSIENVFGIKSEEVLNTSFLNYLNPSSKEVFKNAIKNIKKGKKEQDTIIDLEMNCPSKGFTIVEATLKYFPDSNTHSTYVITLRDVTRQRQNEQEAQRYLRIFKSVFESSLDGLALFSPHNLKIWDYSNKFLTIMGFFPFQTAIGYSLIDLFRNVEGISLEELKEKFLEKNGWEGEFSFVNKQGQKVWVDASVLHLEMPQGTWGFLRLRDITAQKEQTKLLSFIDTAIEKAVESILFLKKENNEWVVFKRNKAADIFFKKYLKISASKAPQFFHKYWSNTQQKSFFEVLDSNNSRFQKKIEITVNNTSYLDLNYQNFVYLTEFIPVFIEENHEKAWIILIHDITYEERIALILKQKEEEQQRQIMEAIYQGQEEERKRVAEDLHDSVGPLLSFLKMKLSMIYEKEQDQQLQESIALVDQITQEIRSISRNLMPTTLYQLGFISAIKELTNHIQKHTSLTIHLDISEISTNFEPEFTLNLFRVIQEIFNNIIKHAEATEVYFQINEDEEGLWIIIEDNGKGFDVISAQQSSKGMGLKNIQTRIHLLGGNVEFDSQPGRGTTITIDIPYNQMRKPKNIRKKN